MQICLRRAYDPPNQEDGTRVLVDRVWPRGIRKGDAQIDLWVREVAPSSRLRKWFGHDPEKWLEFKKRYFEELDGKNRDHALARIRDLVDLGRVTLVFGARDERFNNAVALKEYLEERGRKTRSI